jgi:hypothetical protein
MGSIAKSYMRKSFLIYEEMRKYLTIYYGIKFRLENYLSCAAPSKRARTQAGHEPASFGSLTLYHFATLKYVVCRKVRNFSYFF